MKTLTALGKVAAICSSPLLLALYVYDRSGGNVASWFLPVGPPSANAVEPQSRRPRGITVVPTEPVWRSPPEKSASPSVTRVTRPQATAPATDAIYVVKPAAPSGPFNVTVGTSPMALTKKYDSRSMFGTSKSHVISDEDSALMKVLSNKTMQLDASLVGRLFHRDGVPPLPSRTPGR